MHGILQVFSGLFNSECIRAESMGHSNSAEQPELSDHEAEGPFPIAFWDGQMMHTNSSHLAQNFWNNRGTSLQTVQSQKPFQGSNSNGEQSTSNSHRSILSFIQAIVRSIFHSNSMEENGRQVLPSSHHVEENQWFFAQLRASFESNLDFFKMIALTKAEPLVNELFSDVNETLLAILTIKESNFDDLFNTLSWGLLIQNVAEEKDPERRYHKGKKLLSVLFDLRKKIEKIPESSQKSRIGIYKNYIEGHWNDIWKLIYYYSGNDLDLDPITYMDMQEPFSIPHDGKTRYVVNRATLFSLKYKNPLTGKSFRSEEIRFEKELWEYFTDKNSYKN